MIVGNPPYVEMKPSDAYHIHGYKTGGNLYAPIYERSQILIGQTGHVGLIVPMSGHSTARMTPLVEDVYRRFGNLHIINLSGDANPSMLFQGVKFRLAIVLGSNKNAASHNRFVTGYKKWFAEERSQLFQLLSFVQVTKCYMTSIPKIADPIEQAILNKAIKSSSATLNRYFVGNDSTLYHNAPVSWIRSHSFVPSFSSERDGTKQSTQLKSVRVPDPGTAQAVSAVLSSSLFFMWWIINSDCYHLNKPEIDEFPVNLGSRNTVDNLAQLGRQLEMDLKRNAISRTYNYATSGRVVYDEFYPKLSKPIIDRVDRVLGENYGFSDEEMDYVIHYMEKYRMGRDWLASLP